ncbi:MAG TPA: PQQ-binding-like beta-propeller repeat protein [Verrucomicrobiae bacterium]|nr:PQQ-binding-like beta-propeller repeat protein [Verrucomicrobiae bacterium]
MRAILIAAAFLCSFRGGWSQTQTVPQWPQFRGPGGNAVASDGEPPTHFGPATNRLWKTTVPPGHSSPCIWGSKIFLTGSEGGKLQTLCLDRASGRILWRQTAPVDKIEPAHQISGPASSTPCTDGTVVISYFGSFGLLAYDFDGVEKWREPLPPPMVEFGTGTSPILAGGMVILVSDGDQGSYLLALDRRTGRQIWRTERPEFRRGFASPYLWHHEQGEELVVPGSIWLRSYNLQDGTERWSFTGTSRVANSTPCAGDGLLFSASWNVGADPSDRITLEPFEQFAQAHDANNDGSLQRTEIPAGPLRERFSQMDINKDGRVTPYEWQIMREMFARAGNAVLALRPGGHGDITTSHLAWKSTRSLPYVCSPVCAGGRLYTVKSGGLASCYDAKSGRSFYQDERLDAPGDYYASLIAGDGKIIAISQKGTATVLAAGDSLRILAHNELGAQVMATPALVQSNLYVRTDAELIAFAESHSRLRP